jgi:hypothetical protein
MASIGCMLTRPYAPRAAVGPRPLEYVEMASLGCLCARPLVQWTAVGPRPLENTKPAQGSKLLAPVLLDVLLVLLSLSRRGAHPRGAHKATGNEAVAVDLAEDQGCPGKAETESRMAE